MAQRHFIYGFHAVGSRLRQSAAGVLELYLEEGRDDRRMQELAARAEALGLRTIRAGKQRLDGMAGSPHHQGVVARVEPIKLAGSVEQLLEHLQGPALLLVLDGVQDPHNLGACLRVADAFGTHAVIAPKDRAVGITATVSKVASGAAETVPFISVTNLARTLRLVKDHGIWIWGAAEDGERGIADLDLRGPTAWVLGAEGSGMRRLTRDCCDGIVRIPMCGTVESLNVSVAAGVCLYESARQRAGGHQPPGVPQNLDPIAGFRL